MVAAINAMYISCCKISLPVPYLGGYDPCVGGLYMSCHSLLQTLLLHHSKMLSWHISDKFLVAVAPVDLTVDVPSKRNVTHIYLCRYCRIGSLVASSSPPSTVDRPTPRQGLLMHDFFKTRPARYKLRMQPLFNIQSKCVGFGWLVL